MVQQLATEIPEGANPEFTRELLEHVKQSGLIQAGTVMLIREGAMAGVVAWEYTPMLEVMRFFGLYPDWPTHDWLVGHCRDEPTELSGADLFRGPDRRFAVVQTGDKMTLAQVEEMLHARRS